MFCTLVLEAPLILFLILEIACTCPLCPCFMCTCPLPPQGRIHTCPPYLGGALILLVLKLALILLLKVMLVHILPIFEVALILFLILKIALTFILLVLEVCSSYSSWG